MSVLAAAIAITLIVPTSASSRLAVDVDARSLAPGELAVLTITIAPPAQELEVRAFDRVAPTFQVTPSVWRALIGIDLEAAPGTYPVSIDAVAGTEHPHAIHRLVVAPRRFPTRALTVDEAFVHPPKSVADRIAHEAAELTDLWDHPWPGRLWTGPFVRPVPGPANSRFGTRSIFNGEPRSPHAGADFLSPAGTPIEAPAAGRVVLASDLYFSGNTVMIDHGQGVFSMLAHMLAMTVQPGEMVSAGQLIGRVGATGRVTGAHLHWAVRVAGARVDPISVLQLLGR